MTDQFLATIPYSHPADGQYNFSNYLTGIQARPNDYWFFTSIFSDGSRGQQEVAVHSDAKDVMINPQQAEVKKIHIHHGKSVVVGIRFTDKDNKTILEVGLFNLGFIDKHIELKEGERIVGVKSMRDPSDNLWFGLTFVMGWLE